MTEINLFKGTTRVEARWETPDMLNGVLERYILYVSEVAEDHGNVVYNNSDFFLDYVIDRLVPGSTYYIRLSVSSASVCCYIKITLSQL